MTTKTEIDAKVAELESLLGGVDQRLTEPPKKKRKMPSWLAIVGVAAAIDLAARFFVPASMPFVQIFEAVVFLAAAVGLSLPVIRKSEMTGFRRKLHTWLAAAFALGAIRSGLWGFGLPVEYANLTIFLMGLVGVAGAYFRRRKTKEDEAGVSEFDIE